MNEVYKKFNLTVLDEVIETEKVHIVNTTDGLFVVKLMTDIELKNYKLLSKTKYDYLKPLSSVLHNNLTYYLFNYQKTTDKEVDRAKKLVKEVSILHSKTKEQRQASKMDSFKFKKMIVIMNDKFNSIELKIREIEMLQIKDDNAWIVLSKYHLILDAKLTIYKLIKKVSRDIEKEELEYCYLHSYPTFEHFKGNKLISYTYLKKGYYVNDLYKIYIELEYLDFDIKGLIEPYLKTPFSKRYFKLMVLYTYTLMLDQMNLINYEYIIEYIFYTNRFAKVIALFKDYN